MWDMSDATLGTGGVKSSLTDMMQYLKANMGYATSSLDDALALTHETTQELNYPFTMGLGWGKIVDQQDGKHLIWHNGGTAGTVTFLGFVPELDLGVVILFNTEINERIGQDYSLELIKGVEVIRELKRFRS
jgi:serine-type D-Ala-D-Ala carboxypeptidase/endopeptidase